MAYVRRSPEEEALLQQQQTGAAPAAAASGGGAAPGVAPQAAGPTKGSGYVGLDSYLSANRGGAKAMADGLADAADTGAQAARGAVSGTLNAFGAAAQAGAPTYAAGGAKPGDYTGPADLDAFAQGNNSGRSPQEMVQRGAAGVERLGTFDGRGTALQDVYGQGRGYGQGAQRLDSFLAGAEGGGRFEQLQKDYADLPGAWDAARKSAATQADAAKAGAGAAQQQYADYAKAQSQQQAQAAAVERTARAAETVEQKRERVRRRSSPYEGLDGYARGSGN